MLNFAKLKHQGTVALPSLFTIGNMACGFFAILAAIDKEFARAGWLIIGAMVMDSLDGRVARLVKAESKFGVEIDSLADFLSFGVAPAYIMYLFLLKDYGFWGYPVAFIYALCGVLRLARFNVMSHDGKSSKKYFTGLPIPAGAGILASFVLSYSLLESDSVSHSMKFISSELPLIYTLIPFLMIGISLLMVSNIPYAAFKSGNLFKPQTIKGLVFGVALVTLIFAYPQNSIFIVFSLYVMSGLIARMWRAFYPISQQPEAGQEPPPPPPTETAS